jgi:hypothetical protein
MAIGELSHVWNGIPVYFVSCGLQAAMQVVGFPPRAMHLKVQNSSIYYLPNKIKILQVVGRRV